MIRGLISNVALDEFYEAKAVMAGISGGDNEV